MKDIYDVQQDYSSGHGTLSAALDYAKRNWYVLPNKPRDKIPLLGSHGFKDCTIDQETITAKWTANPDCN